MECFFSDEAGFDAAPSQSGYGSFDWYDNCRNCIRTTCYDAVAMDYRTVVIESAALHNDRGDTAG